MGTFFRLRKFRIPLFLILVFCLLFASACADSVLTVPASVTEIQEEAFSGISAEKVELPIGIRSIGKKAFADSSVRVINLPASLTFIAEDAFENCPDIRAKITNGTYAQEYCASHSIPIIVDLQAAKPESIEIVRFYNLTQLYPGQTVQLVVYVYPTNAVTALSYSSSDPSVATVDERGIVTGVEKGKAVITAIADNGVSGSVEVEVAFDSPELSFALLSDGSGYEITGCDASAYHVNIPAAYNGLPVKAISGTAFINCEDLRSFSVDKNQPVFYVDQGVLFSDSPVKTLIRFPNNYGQVAESYTVPEGTKAIAPYAFAGLRRLSYLHVPEGVTSMGSYAFMNVGSQVLLYLPDSLNEIGEHLLQGQKANVAFYCKKDSYAEEYAQKYQIPCANIVDRDDIETTVEEVFPDQENDPDPEGVNADNIVHVSEKRNIFDVYSIVQRYDLSEAQQENPSEVRLHLDLQWVEFIGDETGKTRNGYPAQQGLYGIGYTTNEIILRGYDLQWNVISTRKVSGNFTFALPGAYNIGVSGGTDTRLAVMPYKPVYIASAGSCPVDPDRLYSAPGGNAFQFYVLSFPRGNISFSFYDYMNVFGYSFYDVAEKEAGSSSCYSVLTVDFRDPSMLSLANQIAIRFDSMQQLFNNNEFACYANASYGLTDAYGKQLNTIFSNVKKLMVSHYYPATAKINKVTASVNGRHPSSFMSMIDLDDLFVPYKDSDAVSYAHEMVHAIDQSHDIIGSISPSPWMEGRAEYISRKVCDQLGIDEYYAYPDDYDWSFLSEQDKSDFFHYFAYSTNRNTEYPVGYYFFKYLCETYGENISQKITEKMIAVQNQYDPSEDKRIQLFRECVVSVTSPDVFQDFVRDVVSR